MNVPYYTAALILLVAFLYVTGRYVTGWYVIGWYVTGRYVTGGYVTGRLASGSRSPHPFGLPLFVGLGMGCCVVVSFLLCAVGGYTTGVLRTLFWATLLLGLLWVAWRACRDPQGFWASLRHACRDGRPVDQVFLLLLVLPTLLLAITPEVAWDAQVYHLAVPRRYLEAGGFVNMPFLVYSNWPLAAELLFGWTLAIQDHVLAKLLHWGCGAMLLLSVYRYCRLAGHVTAGLLAAALLMLTEVVFHEMRLAYVELLQSLWLFLAFVIWEQSVCTDSVGADSMGTDSVGADANDPQRRRNGLVLAGVLLGLVAGTKLTGPVAAVILVVCHLVFVRPRRLGELCWLAGIPFLLWLPWAIKSAVYTGNPVYPFLHGWLGGVDWSPALGEQLQAWQSSMGMGRGALDYLLLPYRLIFESGPGYANFDGGLSPAWALALPLAVVGAVLEPRCRRLVLVGVLYAVYWALSSQQARLLIPALVFLAVAAGLGGAHLWCRWLPALRWGPAAVSIAGSVVLLTVVFVEGRRFWPLWEFRPALSGSEEQIERQVPDYLRYVNEQLPEDARVLFLRENRGYFCRRDYVCDSFFEASQLREVLQRAGDLDGALGWLRQQGITHVLVGKGPVAQTVRLPEYFTRALLRRTGFRPVHRSVLADVYLVVDR